MKCIFDSQIIWLKDEDRQSVYHIGLHDLHLVGTDPRLEVHVGPG